MAVASFAQVAGEGSAGNKRWRTHSANACANRASIASLISRAAAPMADGSMPRRPPY